jgi:hypothetical protein
MGFRDLYTSHGILGQLFRDKLAGNKFKSGNNKYVQDFGRVTS